MGEFHVAQVNPVVVGRVETEPAVLLDIKHLNPCVSLACSFNESADISCRNTIMTAYGYHQMRKVLTHTLALINHFLCRCLHIGGLRDVGEDGIDMMHNGLRLFHTTRFSHGKIEF